MSDHITVTIDAAEAEQLHIEYGEGKVIEETLADVASTRLTPEQRAAVPFPDSRATETAPRMTAEQFGTYVYEHAGLTGHRTLVVPIIDEKDTVAAFTQMQVTLTPQEVQSLTPAPGDAPIVPSIAAVHRRFGHLTRSVSILGSIDASGTPVATASPGTQRTYYEVFAEDGSYLGDADDLEGAKRIATDAVAEGRADRAAIRGRALIITPSDETFELFTVDKPQPGGGTATVSVHTVTPRPDAETVEYRVVFGC